MAISGTVRSRRRKEAGGVPGSWFVFHAQRHKIQSCNVSEFQFLRIRSPFRKPATLRHRCPFPFSSYLDANFKVSATAATGALDALARRGPWAHSHAVVATV